MSYEAAYIAAITELRNLRAWLEAYDDVMDDAHNEGENARPPEGDDYNEVWGRTMTVLNDLIYSAILPGDEYINLRDEDDLDEESNERTTPAGSRWRITGMNDAEDGEKTFNLVCDATGAWICPSRLELLCDFKRVEKPTA